MATAARTGADEVSAFSQKSQSGITRNLVKIDFTSYTALAPYEVDAIFASQGITSHSLSIRFRQRQIKQPLR